MLTKDADKRFNIEEIRRHTYVGKRREGVKRNKEEEQKMIKKNNFTPTCTSPIHVLSNNTCTCVSYPPSLPLGGLFRNTLSHSKRR